MYDRYYQIKKDAASRIYSERPLVYSPFFKQSVFLTSEGFHHLSVSAKGERSRDEQIQRFILLPLGLHILETTKTLRKYRRHRVAIASGRSLSKKRKIVRWWTFIESFGKESVTVCVVVRKVGNGKLHFWSVMLHTNGIGLGTPRIPTPQFSKNRSGGAR